MAISGLIAAALAFAFSSPHVAAFPAAWRRPCGAPTLLMGQGIERIMSPSLKPGFPDPVLDSLFALPCLAGLVGIERQQVLQHLSSTHNIVQSKIFRDAINR